MRAARDATLALGYNMPMRHGYFLLGLLLLGAAPAAGCGDSFVTFSPGAGGGDGAGASAAGGGSAAGGYGGSSSASSSSSGASS